MSTDDLVRKWDFVWDKLSDKQKDYIENHVKRSKKSLFNRRLLEFKSSVATKGLSSEEVEDLMEGWQLKGYIDSGFVNPKTTCECGRALRYQYIVQHKETEKILKLGVEHLKEYIGISAKEVEFIVEGLQLIDKERDDLLEKINNNWSITDELTIPDGFILPSHMQEHLENGVPLLEEQLKVLRKQVGNFIELREREWLKKQESEIRKRREEEVRLEQMEKVAERARNMGIESKGLQTLLQLSNDSVPNSVSVIGSSDQMTFFSNEQAEKVEKSYHLSTMKDFKLKDNHIEHIETYLQHQKTNARFICELLIKHQIAPDNRYVTGKPKIYVSVCLYLDSLVTKGRLVLDEEESNSTDRKYKLVSFVS